MESNSLIICYDYSEDEDKTALMVGRISGASITVLNVFYGSEASTIYEKLTGKPIEKIPEIAFIKPKYMPTDAEIFNQFMIQTGYCLDHVKSYMRIENTNSIVVEGLSNNYTHIWDTSMEGTYESRN